MMSGARLDGGSWVPGTTISPVTEKRAVKGIVLVVPVTPWKLPLNHAPGVACRAVPHEKLMQTLRPTALVESQFALIAVSPGMVKVFHSQVLAAFTLKPDTNERVALSERSEREYRPVKAALIQNPMEIDCAPAVPQAMRENR